MVNSHRIGIQANVWVLIPQASKWIHIRETQMERNRKCCVPFSRDKKSGLVIVHACEEAIWERLTTDHNKERSIKDYKEYYASLVHFYLYRLAKPVILLPYMSMPKQLEWFENFRKHPLWSETKWNSARHGNKEQNIHLQKWVKERVIWSLEVCGGGKSACHNFFLQQLLNHWVVVRYEERGIF